MFEANVLLVKLIELSNSHYSTISAVHMVSQPLLLGNSSGADFFLHRFIPVEA